MKPIYLISLLLILLGLSAAPAARAQPGPAPAVQPAYFMFDIPPAPETFVVRIDSPAVISQARAMLSGQAPMQHIMGKIVKTRAAYNSPWGYHLDPASISFFDVAIETCDGSMQGIQDHLSEVGGALLPGYTWCPWGSRLRGEVAFELLNRVYLPAVGK